MLNERFFINKDGTLSTEAINLYNNIVNYANRHNLTNTLIAVDLALDLHYGTYRDGGAPYIIHPLETTNYLILLKIRSTIFDMNLSLLHDKALAESQTRLDLDILLSSMLLHDTIEDCKNKLVENGKEFVTKYKLHPDILKYVLILTKDKSASDFSLDKYFENICHYWQTLVMKLVDRVNNCSTIYCFSNVRMEKYVKETKKYFYSMAAVLKNSFPEFSRQSTILKYLFVSICETVASSLSIKDIVSKEYCDKSFYFIKGFAIGKNMPNTLKALPLSREYYKGLKRKSGDLFLIHPLRVCSYLISLKIDDDFICAAALLHEIIKKCRLPYNGIEIVTEHYMDNSVLELIRLVSNSENYPLELYYDSLKHNPKAMLLKLSNRAHTCTTLIDYSPEEFKAYVEECEKYIYPLCEYGIKHYPEYAYSIQVMHYHISSLCNIVKQLRG